MNDGGARHDTFSASATAKSIALMGVVVRKDE
jgi:hypothetical protein